MSEIYNSTYFVTGGGTGGHIYPAIAIADALTDSKVYYVGNKRNMEFELATKKGYKFLHVSIKGMPRKLSPRLFMWGIKLVKAIIRSIRYIKKYKPNAVFATGGYVSAPMIFACIITKTSYIMHDCDAMPGLVTRRLSKRAKYVTLAFENAKKYIPNKKSVVTGNPIREGFKTISKTDAKQTLGLSDNKVTLCIMGGSQGAKSVNNTTIELLKEFSQEMNLQIIFQTGKKNYEDVIERVRQIYPSFEQDKNIIIRPYFEDMVSVLKSSDIVVSRAGSLSLSEICVSGLASLLIPYPYAAADHQRKNAQEMAEQGAALYLEDKECTAESFMEKLEEIINDTQKMIELQNNAKKLVKYDATKNIVEQIKDVLNKSEK